MNGAIDASLGSCRREFPPILTRRGLFPAALSLAWVLAVHHSAWADSPTAPIPVQAQIIARILPFERGFAARVTTSVTILIFERNGDADSGSAARQMEKALSDIAKISGKPIRAQTLAYTNARNLANECSKRAAAAVFLTPGLAQEIKAIAAALVGSEVLSVAAVESYAADGAVLAVEVVSGKPRMSINLTQAKAQKLDFPSALLSLAKVYR